MYILIVEDDLLSLKSLELHLKKQNYKTLTAGSGAEALDILNERDDIWLVLSDVMMPDMDGIDLLKAIKTDDVLTDIPVIMCTALNDMETVQKAIQLGCRQYVVKPIVPAQLLTKVYEVLGHHVPVLQDKKTVMEGLKIDGNTYYQILRAFSTQLDELIDVLEKKEAGELKDVVASGLYQGVLKSALRLEARRLEEAAAYLVSQSQATAPRLLNRAKNYLLYELNTIKREIG